MDGCNCAACRPNTFTSQRMILCAICGNKRCPHATDHRHACSGSNEPGQYGSVYGIMPAPAMTRATWPLSRDAVEAAAREMLAYFSDPDDVPHDEDLNAAARALRAAIAAWVPSEGQVEAGVVASHGVAPEHCPCSTDGLCEACRTAEGPSVTRALLAAVRTEAAE